MRNCFIRMLSDCSRILAMLTAALSGAAFGQAATYDGASRYFTLPSVAVGDTTYLNVVIRLDGFAVISVSGTGGSVAATCSTGMLTLAKFNAVALGMSLAQVDQLMGCQNTTALTTRSSLLTTYTWFAGGALIIVYFDPTGSVVQALTPGASFKVSSGI